MQSLWYHWHHAGSVTDLDDLKLSDKVPKQRVVIILIWIIFYRRWFPTEGVCLAGECCPLAVSRNAGSIGLRFAGQSVVSSIKILLLISFSTLLPGVFEAWFCRPMVCCDWQNGRIPRWGLKSLGSNCLDFQPGHLKVKRDRIFIYAGKTDLGTRLFQAISQRGFIK